MQIVLTKDIPQIGRRGDVRTVKPGYFQNYLYPQKLAVVATPVLMKQAEEREKKRAIEKERLTKEAKEIIKKFEGLELEFVKKTSSKGKLYAALTGKHIVEAVLEKAKVEIGEENVVMEPIKEEGEHEVTIRLVEGIEAKVKVIVKKEES